MILRFLVRVAVHVRSSRALRSRLVETAGYGMITAGAWQLAHPAGLAVGGAFLVLIGYSISAPPRRPKQPGGEG